MRTRQTSAETDERKMSGYGEKRHAGAPRCDEPASDKLMSDEPASDKLMSDEPASDKLMSDEPAPDKLMSDEAASDKRMSDEPASDKRMHDEPAPYKPMHNEPTLEEMRGQGRENADSKRLLRKAALAKRDSLTKEQRLQKSGQIAERLFAHPWYREAECLLVYASYRSEVSTEEIIRSALQSGKQVYCPVVTGKREMIFCALDGPLADAVLSAGLAAMEKDRHGIPQPDAGTCAHYAYQPEKSLAVMPGCAFDDKGNRIGYGGGFYDRFLAERPMRTIALFFDCQRTDEAVADESHDVRPDLILTESGFYAAESGGIRNGEPESESNEVTRRKENERDQQGTDGNA